MTIESLLSDHDLESVRAQLAECEQIQSFAPGSTRSSWTGELRAIIDAHAAGDADALAEAIEAADAEAMRLATEVARSLVDVDNVRARLVKFAEGHGIDSDVVEALEAASTIEELIGVARRSDVEWAIVDADLGVRDGYKITGEEAVAFASARSWRPNLITGVDVDMLTGEVTTW